MATTSTSDLEVSDELHEFSKAFLISAEKSLELLKTACGGADVDLVYKLSKVVPYFTEQQAAVVSSTSQEILQIQGDLRGQTHLTDSWQNVQKVFNAVCMSAAKEIYCAFDFQWQRAYLKVDGKKDELSALKTLGEYAGERCFLQLLETGSPENLHFILVPSIRSSGGFNFEEEAKSNWKTILDITDTEYLQIKTAPMVTLRYKTKTKVKKITAATFFNQCIPGFGPDIHAVKQLLEKKKKKNSILVNQIRGANLKQNLLRRPFNIEIKNIKTDNLVPFKIESYDADRRTPADFTCNYTPDLVATPVIPARVETLSSDTKISNELYEFIKFFVGAAEKVFTDLDKASKLADLASKGFSAINGGSKHNYTAEMKLFSAVCSALGAIVPLLSREVFQKKEKNKAIAAIQTDSSQNYQDEFKIVFISAAIEIYNAFKFQLLNVYHRVDRENISEMSAIRILGAFAGERCFEQLLKTGLAKDLHRILVPSINNENGYEFKVEAKTAWDSLTDFSKCKDTITKYTSFVKGKLTEKLRLSINGVKIKRTAADFFNDCIPGFDPGMYEIKIKRNGNEPASNQIVVDKKKKETTKRDDPQKQLYFLRSPFKIEAENIKADNLEILDVSGFDCGRRQGDFDYEDVSHLADKILQKIKFDKSYDPETTMITLLENIGPALENIDFGLKQANSQLVEIKDLVKNNIPERKPVSPIWFQVQDPPHPFIGRSQVLKDIKKNIEKQQQGDGKTVISKTTIICGLGGVGKTTIARKFRHIFEEVYGDCNVVFIDAETHKSMTRSFTNLAFKLKICKDHSNFDLEMIESVYEEICQQRCLLVFDNAEFWESEVKGDNGINQFLPPLPKKFIKHLSILITTRNSKRSSWENLELILVNVFDKMEGNEFITGMLEEDKEKQDDIAELMNLCGNLPLALKLIVACINQNKNKLFKSGYTIQQFLAEDKIKDLVGKGDNQEKPNILYTLWDLSLANIIKDKNGKLALFILDIMSFSHRPDMMNFEYFEQYFFKDDVEEYLAGALELLVKYSMISKFIDSKAGTCFSIHRMIQMVTKEKLLGSINRSSKFIVELVSNLNPIGINHDRFGFIRDLTHLIFSAMIDKWDPEKSWKFAKQTVGTIMGEQNMDCSEKLLSSVHDTTMNYANQINDFKKIKQDMLSRLVFCNRMLKGEKKQFWNFPEFLPGPSAPDDTKQYDETIQTANIGTKYRLVFFAEVKWSDFKQKAKVLCRKADIFVKNAEDFVRVNTGNRPSEVQDSTVLLTVFVEKLKTSSVSDVLIFFNSTDKRLPKELCDGGGEENNSQIVFLLLPTKYYMAFGSFLRIILKPIWFNFSAMMCNFIALNIFAPIVSTAKFKNDIGTIQSLISIIGQQKIKTSSDKCSNINPIWAPLKCNSLQQNKIYEFSKSFVDSAEEALKSLEKSIKEAESESIPFNTNQNEGETAAVTTFTLREEILHKINTYKVSRRQNPINWSPLNFQHVFQEVFVSAAKEIFAAFRLQLNNVYVENVRAGNGSALQILGRYAGKKCFQQLLKTGSPENLHLILVPSILKGGGYNIKEENTKWEALGNGFQNADIPFSKEATIINQPWFSWWEIEHISKIPAFDSFGITMSTFFDNCVPAFYPQIPSINRKLKEHNLTWTSASIAVDKTRRNETKSNRDHFLRRPFKIEAEEIKADNIEILEIKFRKTSCPLEFIYPILDEDHVIDKVCNETWDLSSANISEISKRELLLLILKFVAFSCPNEFRVEHFKQYFGRCETAESITEALESLVNCGLIFKDVPDPRDKTGTYYFMPPMDWRLNNYSIIRNSNDTLDFFLYLASALNYNLGSYQHISKCVDNIFSMVYFFWNDEKAWKFASEIVRTLMGKDHLDSARIAPYIFAVAKKYTRRHNNPDQTLLNLYYVPVKQRVLFLTSKTLEGFLATAKSLDLPQQTVEKAQKYFTKNADKVLLSVLTGNVENLSESRVWVVNSEKDNLPEAWDDWDKEDVQIVHMLLPYKHYEMFVLLLKKIFNSRKNINWEKLEKIQEYCFINENRIAKYVSMMETIDDLSGQHWMRIMEYFIGAIILAEIVMKLKLSGSDLNSIDTVHSLIAMIGKAY